MQVGDKLAKEKLARILDDYAEKQNMAWVQPRHSIKVCAQLIRNADLADCAPDQGSVRNATDMRERCVSLLSEYKSPWATEKNHLLTEIAAAIRALPDQKD